MLTERLCFQKGVGCSEWRWGPHTRTQTHCQDCQLYSGQSPFLNKMHVNLFSVHISCVHSFGWNKLGYFRNWFYPWGSFCLSFQDSNCLLTGGNDKLLRIYDLSDTQAGKWMWELNDGEKEKHVVIFCGAEYILRHTFHYWNFKIVLSFLYPSAPQEISGHTSAIKKALWCNNDKQILSAAEDKTIRSVMLHDSCSDLNFSVQKLKKKIFFNYLHLSRLWDRTSMEEVKTLTFDTSVSSMEYVADGEILVITYGKTIAFYNALRFILFLLLIYCLSTSMGKICQEGCKNFLLR